MDFVKKIKNRKIVIFALIILCALTIFLIIYNKMDYANVYYRTYTKEKGWTKWSKNGEMCGTESNITAIQVKVKSNISGTVKYISYYNKKWEEKDRINKQQSGNKTNEINSIRIKLTGKLKKKYDIKYKVSTAEMQWYDYVDNWMRAYASPIEQDKLNPIVKVKIKLQKK